MFAFDRAISPTYVARHVGTAVNTLHAGVLTQLMTPVLDVVSEYACLRIYFKLRRPCRLASLVLPPTYKSPVHLLKLASKSNKLLVGNI